MVSGPVQCALHDGMTPVDRTMSLDESRRTGHIAFETGDCEERLERVLEHEVVVESQVRDFLVMTTTPPLNRIAQDHVIRLAECGSRPLRPSIPDDLLQVEAQAGELSDPELVIADLVDDPLDLVLDEDSSGDSCIEAHEQGAGNRKLLHRR